MTLSQLGYTLELLEDLTFGSEPAGGLTGCVSGSTIWGAVARNYMTRKKLGRDNGHRDDEFRRLFLRAGLRFLSAYPVSPEDESRRLLPAPSTIFHKKQDPESAVDRAYPPDADVESVAPVHGFCESIGDALVRHSAAVRYEYHTSRTSRALGRAVAGGGPFAYPVLERGQKLRGLVLGAGEDLRRVLDDLKDLRLGRSKSAQYGRVRISVDDPPISDFNSEAPYDARAARTEALTVTLTSHLIPGEAGGGTPPREIPFRDFAVLLGVDEDQLRRSCESFAGATVVGGFSSVWQLPRQQAPAIAAGSVLIFRDIDLNAIPNDVESHSVGRRTSEGFGRFVLNWPRVQVHQISEPTHPKATRPQGDPPRELMGIIYKIVEAKINEYAVEKALKVSDKIAKTKGIPSSSSLNRIRAILEPKDGDFKKHLARLAEDPNRQFGKVLRRLQLRDHMNDFGESDLNEQRSFQEMQVVMQQLGRELPVVNDEAVRVFGLALVADLARQRRSETLTEKKDGAG